MGFTSPEEATYWLISGRVLFAAIHILGLACFAYIVAKRLVPLLNGEHDFRFDRPILRLKKVLRYWLGQWKHPRYRGAGILHILIFSGFLVLAIRAFTVLVAGASESFTLQTAAGGAKRFYDIVTDYAATIVFLCMVVAAIRRIVFKPARYEVPARYGKSHKADAVFLLGLIALLMVADSLYEASKAAYLMQQRAFVEFPAVLSLPWVMKNALSAVAVPTLWNLHRGAYLVHQLTFYFLLCYRPF